MKYYISVKGNQVDEVFSDNSNQKPDGIVEISSEDALMIAQSDSPNLYDYINGNVIKNTDRELNHKIEKEKNRIERALKNKMINDLVESKVKTKMNGLQNMSLQALKQLDINTL